MISTRLVRPGHEQSFHRWADRLDRAALEAPGHRGNLRLEQAGGLFHLVQQFDSEAHLRGWEGSAAFAALMDEGERFSLQRRQSVIGEEARVTLPSDQAASKWKTFVTSWLTVFPLLLVLSTLVGLLPFDLPQPVRLAGSSLLLSAMLTWIVLPRVNRRTKPWTLRNRKGELRKRGE